MELGPGTEPGQQAINSPPAALTITGTRSSLWASVSAVGSLAIDWGGGAKNIPI